MSQFYQAGSKHVKILLRLNQIKDQGELKISYEPITNTFLNWCDFEVMMVTGYPSTTCSFVQKYWLGLVIPNYLAIRLLMPVTPL